MYLAVLRFGKITPAKVAAYTKMRRPNVYNVASSLVSKGVIAEDVADKTMHLLALPPTSLAASVNRAKADIQKREALVGVAVEQLTQLVSEKTYPVPRLRFVEEGELRDYLFQNADKWHRSVIHADKVWWGFQDHSFVEQYKEWIEWAGKRFAESSYTVKLLSNVSSAEQNMHGKIAARDVRFLEDTAQFTSTTWVAGEYIVMISNRKRPFYLIEIHDALMAQNMREMFKKMWILTQ